jgi:hypothetical protein
MTTLDAFHQNEQASIIGSAIHDMGNRLEEIEDQVFVCGGMPVLALVEDEFVRLALRVLNLTHATAMFNSSKRRPIVS